MKLKNKSMIALFSCFFIVVASIVLTIIVIASGTQGLGTNLSVIYVATEIEGSVSATYSLSNKSTSEIKNSQNMMTNDGATTVSFYSSNASQEFSLSPSGTITMEYGYDVLLTYTFTNGGEEYFALVEYTDTSSASENLKITYKGPNDSDYLDSASVLSVPAKGTAIYYIKISIVQGALNASLNGTFNWQLSKENPKAEYDGSITIAKTNNKSVWGYYLTNDDESDSKLFTGPFVSFNVKLTPKYSKFVIKIKANRFSPNFGGFADIIEVKNVIVKINNAEYFFDENGNGATLPTDFSASISYFSISINDKTKPYVFNASLRLASEWEQPTS